MQAFVRCAIGDGMLLLDRRSECRLYGPSSPDTRTNRVGVESIFASPVCNVFGFTVMRQHLDMRTIARLLQPCSPANIAWFVVSFVVYSVNAMLSRWSNTNILVESEKRIKPTVTNGDAPTAIAIIKRILWIVAAVFHHCPTAMFRRISESIRLFSKASTRLCSSSAQGVPSYRSCVSALAFTKPLSFASARHSIPANDSEPAVHIASLVFCEFGCRIFGSHDIVPMKQVVVRTARRPQSSGCSHYYATSGWGRQHVA